MVNKRVKKREKSKIRLLLLSLKSKFISFPMLVLSPPFFAPALMKSDANCLVTKSDLLVERRLLLTGSVHQSRQAGDTNTPVLEVSY